MKRGVAALNRNVSRGWLFSLLVCFLLFLPLFSHAEDYRYFCLRFKTNRLIYAVKIVPVGFSTDGAWVERTWPSVEFIGAPSYDYKIRNTDTRLVAGFVGDQFTATPSNVETANNFFSAIDDPLDFNLFDYTSGVDSGIPSAKPAGSPILDGSGIPVGVVGYNEDGEKTFLPVVQEGNGYAAVGYDENGNQGIYTLNPGVDGMWPHATFTPVPDSGSGESGSNTPITDNINPPQTDESGQVATPSETVTIPNGNGGSSTITMRDYTPLLSQIAKNQIEGINRVDSSLSDIKDALTIDNATSVDVAPLDNADYTLDTSEADSIAEEVSGWGFSFGMSQNPIGGIFTSILGNPPTSFGSVDRVWSVDFDLGFTTVTSTFSLSDFFISAFRSCILMIETILIAIAIAKAISGAFS